MYQDYPSTSHTDTLVSFALGMAAGAAVALIFAPASGRDTRAFLANKGRSAAAKGREWAEEGSRAVHTASDTVKQRVSEAVEHGKRGYRDAIHRGQDAFKDVSDDIGNMARSGE
jgi:gas vesicle protein